jgi:dCTP deaminase
MTGVLASQQIETLIATGGIRGVQPIDPAQIQPASLDLRLGNIAYRVRASFLSGQGRSVADRLGEFEMHRIDLDGGAVLEKGCVYVVPLMESLDLPTGTNAVANAKSSTGRLDLLTRTITDRAKNSTVSQMATPDRSMPRFAPDHFPYWCGPACGLIKFGFARVRPS